MNNYITGTAIKSLRDKKGLTQSQLADIINVSDKAALYFISCICDIRKG